MEQKHLDEVDDSFFTEEFIDEDDLAKYNKYDFPDEKIDPFADDKKSSRGSFKREEKEVLEKFPRKKAVEESKSAPKNAPPKPIAAKETKPSLEKKDLKEASEKKDKEKKKEEDVPKLDSADKKIKIDNISSSKPELFDPWKEEKASDGLFKEASTWKAITGIMIILLIFSVFTSGFKFSEPTGAAVSIKDAEKTVIDYVNNNLLQAPFVAELEGSEDAGSLYKVQLSVAGQKIDSYVTKDGKLFFPQGFDLNKPLAEEALGSDLEADSNNQANNQDTPVVGEEVIEPEETEVIVSPEEVSLVLLNAKKWVFTPKSLEVRKGDIVQLNIVPEDLDFTFSIPELNIEKEIKGKTLIEFKVDKEGEYSFNCKSCEDWRGMNGKLVVK